MKNILEQIKSIYWNNRLLDEETKESFFYIVKSLINGKTKSKIKDDSLKRFKNEILNIQDFNNMFSIDRHRYPEHCPGGADVSGGQHRAAAGDLPLRPEQGPGGLHPVHLRHGR